ncbi:hypothetical protein PAQ31011_04356 [Pandoraea aquatica]|uniref:Uncharacterized protein n=1 Tax=Pandoraea aquatica TaxID=2508290 RepID=A0A5E4Y896_9BURK|nr:hypothetical protein PAQ31011_04356 [Pandoraea aquatica]
MTERLRPTVMLDKHGGMAAAVPLFYPQRACHASSMCIVLAACHEPNA